ncbi:MAG: hypothetical protein U9Q37_07715 [Euryarchaeota archaeon]|nr:hypothetical protein [Euryarchaeota archaeon]
MTERELLDAQVYYMYDLGASGSDVVGDQHLFDQGAAIHKFTIPETGMSMSFAVSEREKMTQTIHPMDVRAKQADMRVWNCNLGRLSAGKVATRTIDEQTG